MLASRASTWPRDHFCRSTMAPRPSRPTTWNEFLPRSMPMVATVAIDLLDMAVAPFGTRPHLSITRRWGQEHGRTIPLAGTVLPRGRRAVSPDGAVLGTGRGRVHGGGLSAKPRQRPPLRRPSRDPAAHPGPDGRGARASR